MNAYLRRVGLLLALFIVGSCSDNMIENSENSSLIEKNDGEVDLNSLKSEFSFALARVLNESEGVRKLIKEEAIKQFDHDYDVLYMMDNVDEFMIQMMRDYDSKAFKNVAQGDLNLDSEEEKKELEKINEDNKSLLESLKEALKDKVVDVKVSNRLKSHPVCLVSDQGVSFEMEKVLNAMPDGQDVKAGRILEINPNHDIFKAIQNVYQNHADKINDYASLLFDQALLIEGLSIEDPVAFSNKICELMIELNK